MKNAIMPLAVFATVLIGSTVVRVTTTPQPPPVINADSLALAVAQLLVSDSVIVPPAPAAPAHGEPAGEGHAAAPAETVVARQPPAPPPEPAGPTQEEVNEAYRTMARIFAQMQPAQAAEVLQLMADDEVEELLRNLGARQAAAVLTAMPGQRAAVLAQRLLVPRTEDEDR